MGERRNDSRKMLAYYMQVFDDNTDQLVGHMTDISTGGFRLDAIEPISPNSDLILRLDLTSDVADKAFLEFVARSRWCQQDYVNPFVYNVGFELTEIAPADIEIFHRILAVYAS